MNEIYLINKFAPEEEKLKLKPTDNNDKALKYLLRADPNEEYSDFSKLINNFDYFKKRISKDNYQVVLDGLLKLMFVEISLDREKDNPQRIFESLNSTGLELSQADLVRNYILMGLNRTNQKKIYQNYWALIENLAKDEISNTSKVSDFIRDYLTLKHKNIPNKGKVYSEFKAKYPTGTIEELEEVLSDMKSLVKNYNKLLNPSNESDREIKKQLDYISKLEINVAYPFIVKVYDDFSKEIIDKKTFIHVLELIQSYTWRRFILGLPTATLNQIFMSLYDKVDSSNYLYSIQKSLLEKKGSSRFPRNAETIDALRIKDIYNIKSKNRAYFLGRLENFENREPVNIEMNKDITVEHIFPQNPDPKWKIDLGAEEYNYIKEKYLNTIGNLTLSGNNGKLGNKSFIEKRDLAEAGYKDSRLWLNKHLSGLDKWDRSEIEKRFSIIEDRFLNIWEMPDISMDEIKGNAEINIFEADDPTGRKIEYAIFIEQKLEITQIAKLYAEVIQTLFKLKPDIFFTTELAEKIGLTQHLKEGNPIQSIAISDTYFIEGNIDNKGKFDLMKLALRLSNLEDELLIKYVEEEIVL